MLLPQNTHTHELYSWGWVSSCCISYFYSLLAGPSGSWSPVVYLLVKTNILSSPGRSITARTHWTRDPACTASDQWQHPAGENKISIIQLKTEWSEDFVPFWKVFKALWDACLVSWSMTCVGLGPGPGPIWRWWCSVLDQTRHWILTIVSKWIFENER